MADDLPRFHFTSALRAQGAAEARAAYPHECCGLIEGTRHPGEIAALRLHPARNLAARADRFAIDPAEQFRLLRILRDSDREIVGCYHSHPNGAAVPSQTDRAGAGEEGFVWLIIGIDAQACVAVAPYLFVAGAFHALQPPPGDVP